MKKFFIIFALIFLEINLFADTRTIYITRHGQRGNPKYQIQLEKTREDRLMPNGEIQAEKVGEYLKSIGFNGTVYASPYYRTLQTATFAGNALGVSEIIVEPRIQEISGLKNGSGKTEISKDCITKKEIIKYFPLMNVPKKMKFPWRITNESQGQADKRAGDFINYILENTEGDVLLVCHGGFLRNFVREINKLGANFSVPKNLHYNCCLYSFTFDTDTGKIISSENHTHKFLPKELITDNTSVLLN